MVPIPWKNTRKLLAVFFAFATLFTMLTYLNNTNEYRSKTASFEPVQRNPPATQTTNLPETLVGRKIPNDFMKRRVEEFNNVEAPLKNSGKNDNVHVELTHRTTLPPFKEYWSKMFHFVPKEYNQDCLNLFTTESSKSIKITPKWYETKAAVEKIMSKYSTRYTPVHTKVTLTYQELARQEFVHTVCEIGFNVGESAIAWLTAKPDLKLYSFDIGNNGTSQMGEVIGKLFPGRFKLMIGDSTLTVPGWVIEGVKCDIVSIDGGHDYMTVAQDILNMRQVAKKEHIIIADDIDDPGVHRAWGGMQGIGVVNHLWDCWIHNLDINFAIGYYNQSFKILLNEVEKPHYHF